MKKLVLASILFLFTSNLFATERVAGIFINNTNPSISIVDTNLKFDGKLAGKLGFVYGFNGVELSFAPITLYDEKDKNSDGSAIILNLSKSRYNINLSYEKTEGYTNNKTDTFDENLKSESFTINFSYSVFKDFRLESPSKFNFGEHEHGPLLMTSISKRKLSNSNGILDTDTQSQLGLTSNIKEMDANLGALLIGYGYSGKMKCGIFSTIKLLFGKNIQRNEVDYSDGSHENKNTDDSNANIYAEVGYHFGDSWLLGSSLYVDKFSLKVSESVRTDYNLNNLKFYLKRKF